MGYLTNRPNIPRFSPLEGKYSIQHFGYLERSGLTMSQQKEPWMPIHKTKNNFTDEYMKIFDAPSKYGFKQACLDQERIQTMLFDTQPLGEDFPQVYLDAAHEIIVEELMGCGVRSKVLEFEELTYNRQASSGAFMPFADKGAYVDNVYGQMDMYDWWLFAHRENYIPLWKVSPKEEILPVGKDGRTFEIPPTGYLFTCQRLCSNFNQGLVDTEGHPIMLGYTPTHGGTNALWNSLTFRFGKTLYGMGDVTKMDKNLREKLRNYAQKTRLRTYEGDNYEDYKVRLQYVYDCENNSFFVMSNGEVIYKVAGGMNSGSYLTSSDNSLCMNHVAYAYVIKMVYETEGIIIRTADELRTFMRWALYADDHIFSVPARFSYLADFNNRKKFFASCGLPLKEADDKVQDTPVGLTFLGGIVTLDISGLYVAYYKPDRILAGLWFQHRQMNNRELYNKMLSLQVLSAYSPQFAKICKYINNVYKRLGPIEIEHEELDFVDKYFEPPTFSQLRAFWLGLECVPVSPTSAQGFKRYSMNVPATGKQLSKAEKRKAKRKQLKQDAKNYREGKIGSDSGKRTEVARKIHNPKNKKKRNKNNSDQITERVNVYAKSEGKEVDVSKGTIADSLALTMAMPNVYPAERWGAMTTSKTSVTSCYTREDYPWVSTQTPPVSPPVPNNESFLVITRTPSCEAILYDPLAGELDYLFHFGSVAGITDLLTYEADQTGDIFKNTRYIPIVLGNPVSLKPPVNGANWFTGKCDEEPEGRFIWLEEGDQLDVPLTISGTDAEMNIVWDLWTPGGMMYSALISTSVVNAGTAHAVNDIQAGYYAPRMVPVIIANEVSVIQITGPIAVYNTTETGKPRFRHLASTFFSQNYQTVSVIRPLGSSYLYTNTAAEGFKQGTKYQLLPPPDVHWTNFVSSTGIISTISNDANVSSGLLKTGGYSFCRVTDNKELDFNSYHTVNGNGGLIDSHWSIDNLGSVQILAMKADLPNGDAVQSPQNGVLVMQYACEFKTENQAFPAARPDANYYDSIDGLMKVNNMPYFYDNPNHFMNIMKSLGGGLAKGAKWAEKNWPTIAKIGGAVKDLLL